MAVIDTPRPQFVLAGVVGRVFAKTIGAVAAWNDARLTRTALSRLSDRELDDIGLCRGDIPDIARAL